MDLLSRFSSSSLRIKILFGLLLSLLPMIAIVGITYYSSLNTAENSKRITKLIVQHAAKEINAFITAQESLFADWTKEDIFGMSIEFNTTRELQDQFLSMLKGQKGISMLILTDNRGGILEIAANDNKVGQRLSGLKNMTVKEAAAHKDNTARRATLARSDLMEKLEEAFPYTFVFSFRAHDSGGKHNGYLLAYLDWSVLQDKVNVILDDMNTNGFDEVNVAIVDTQSSTALSHSEEQKIGSYMDIPNSLKLWLQKEKGDEVKRFTLGQQKDYVTASSILGDNELFDGKNRGKRDSNLRLTAFVRENEIMSDVWRILLTSCVVAGVGSLFVILIGLAIVSHIYKPLNRIIEGLSRGAGHVSSASSRISASSQQLARGSTEQASAIEETSASLEETSTMTKQNAGKAREADDLTTEVTEVANKATSSMSELIGSMEDISEASKETSKIIKTIDEIAFQTNLLALNAAVEAARAGEAGAGFAVVADEVRSLSMRAADAAKNTADLIQDTVKKISEGKELVSRTDEDFTVVAESCAKVSQLTSEINAASNEQALGIEQISRSVTEMDKIVIQNASNARDAATDSEQMNTQAEQLRDFVKELLKMVGGVSIGAKEKDQPDGFDTDKIKMEKPYSFPEGQREPGKLGAPVKNEDGHKLQCLHTDALENF